MTAVAPPSTRVALDLPAADIRPDLSPFDRVKFWRFYRFAPDGVRDVPMDDVGYGQLGAHRIVRKSAVGLCLRVLSPGIPQHPGEKVAAIYVPLDAATKHDPNQIAFDVGV